MAAKEYTMAFSIGAKLNGQFNAVFKGAGSTLQSLQGKINSLQKAQSQISAYQKQQQAIDKTRSKLEMLQKQYDNLQAEMGESDNASAAFKNQMLSKQQQIERTSASLDEQAKRLNVMGSALKEAGVNTKDLESESASLAARTAELKQQQDAEAAAMQEAAASAEQMGDSYANAASDMEQMLAAAGLFTVLKKGAEILRACAGASIEFESVMTGVDKTTDLTATEFAEMSAAVKQLSTEIPVTTTELGEVGEVAGQLGIAKGNLLDFSTVMTMLSTATKMTASDAATMSAQFANITDMDPDKYDELGSTVVALGNNYATTEQKILDMGQGIAAAGSLAGMSEADMMGLSTAVTSLGIETQAGSTSMSTLISTLNKAVQTGEGLTDYASVANMSAAEFTRAWGTDAAGALAQFITGLSDTERNGKSAVVILDELGISETRMQRMMLSLATSGDLMTRAIATANTAWQQNTALTAEAEKRYTNTESRLKMASNAANNLKIAVGDALTPAMGTFADVSKGGLIAVTQFVEKNPQLVQGMVTAGGVIGGVTVAITGYSAAAKVAAAASALLTSAIPGVKTLMVVTAGVAALAGAVVGLSGALEDTSVDFATLDADFDGLNEQLKEQERVSDLIEEYKSLSKELSGVSDAAGGIKGGSTSIKVTPDVSKVKATEFIDGAAEVQLSADPQEVAPDAFVEDGKAIIFGQANESVTPAEFLVGNKSEVDLTASITNLADLQAQVASLQTSVTAAQDELNTANADLTAMQKRKGELESRMNAAQNSSDKSALQLEIEALDKQITDQITHVGELQTTYTALSAELMVTQTAADELSAKEQRLAEVKAELAAASGGVITATGDETEAFNQQVDALDALTESKKAGLRAELYENVTTQATKYAEAVKESTEYTAAMAPLLNKAKAAEQYLGMSADEVNAKYQGLLASMDEMASKPGYTPLGDEVQSTIQQIQVLSGLMGEYFEDLSEYADKDISWVEAFGWVYTNEKAWTYAIQDLNEGISEYGEGIEGANLTQKAFVDNLVNGLKLGAVSLEEVKALLTNTFSTTENGGEIVSTVMAQIQAEMAQATADAEGMEEGMDGIAASAAELDAAINPILAQMQALGEAYDAAYQAAYESMDGQFKLFEQAPEVTAASIDDMMAALKSQAEYMQAYTANLQLLSTVGLNPELLAQLSDGSVESAAYVKALADEVANNKSTNIDALNNAYEAAEQEKKNFAAAAAEAQTNFDKTMTDLQAQLTTTVSEMDKSAEAAAAGSATVQAFADAAAALTPTVWTEFQKVANAAKGALKINVRATPVGISAYASGTDDAERGWAMVGENGPELMWFGGGEKVLNNAETEALMNRGSEPLTAISSPTSAGTSFVVEVSPVYNINGNANSDEIRGVLTDQNVNLRALIEDAIEEIEQDWERSRYS